MTVLFDFGSGIFDRLFSEARPVDWLIIVIDLCVLLWIATADIVKLPRWWKRRCTVKGIAAFLVQGEALQRDRPIERSSGEEANAWVEAVKSWVVAVHSFLAKDAVRALAVFGHRSASPPPETSVQPLVVEWSLELEARLTALRTVTQKPEDYI